MASVMATTVCARMGLSVYNVKCPNQSAGTASLLTAHAIALKDLLVLIVVRLSKCVPTGATTMEDVTMACVSVIRGGAALIVVIEIVWLVAALRTGTASTVPAFVDQGLEERTVDL